MHTDLEVLLPDASLKYCSISKSVQQLPNEIMKGCWLKGVSPPVKTWKRDLDLFSGMCCVLLHLMPSIQCRMEGLCSQSGR